MFKIIFPPSDSVSCTFLQIVDSGLIVPKVHRPTGLAPNFAFCTWHHAFGNQAVIKLMI